MSSSSTTTTASPPSRAIFTAAKELQPYCAILRQLGNNANTAVPLSVSPVSHQQQSPFLSSFFMSLFAESRPSCQGRI
jgi:hypothetical protein